MENKMNDHDKLSLKLHCAVKKKLLSEPRTTIMIGKRNLANWKERYDYEPGWMAQWIKILNGGVSSIVPILDGVDESSILLRSSSPFAGVISQKERLRIIHEKGKS